MARLDRLADRHERLYERHKAGILGTQEKYSLTVIGDADFLRTYSGQVTWSAFLNVVARLYKGLRKIRISLPKEIGLLPGVFFPDKLPTLHATSFRLLEDLLDGYVEVEEGVGKSPLDPVVIVGGSSEKEAHRFSVAGRGWCAFIDHDGWRNLPDDGNPIGPMAAACFGAAEVYKQLYGAKTPSKEPFVFSAFDYSSNCDVAPVIPLSIQLPKTYIPGAGAVGMAFLLVLEQLRGVSSSGGLLVVDDDKLDDTNLNRCALATLNDDGEKKIDIIRARIRNAALNVTCFDSKWEDFVKRPEHAADKNYELIVSCVDKYGARRAVQYAKIPKVLLTAGTGDFLLTVSRHILNDGLSCGLCYQARDAEPTCATASDGAQEAFVDPIDPSIGFVSVLAGTLLGAEYLKQAAPAWRPSVVANAARLYVLLRRVKTGARQKDPSCNCSSKHVARGYDAVWKV